MLEWQSVKRTGTEGRGGWGGERGLVSWRSGGAIGAGFRAVFRIRYIKVRITKQ